MDGLAAGVDAVGGPHPAPRGLHAEPGAAGAGDGVAGRDHSRARRRAVVDGLLESHGRLRPEVAERGEAGFEQRPGLRRRPNGAVFDGSGMGVRRVLTHEMDVGVDKSRQHRAGPEIDHQVVGVDCDVGCRSGGGHLPAGDHDHGVVDERPAHTVEELAGAHDGSSRR